MPKLLWLDEAILEIIRHNGGVIELDKLMEELWHMCWKQHRTGCSGWIGYEEGGKIKHWCKQAWEVLKIMEYKGIIKMNNGVIRLNDDIKER